MYRIGDLVMPNCGYVDFKVAKVLDVYNKDGMVKIDADGNVIILSKKDIAPYFQVGDTVKVINDYELWPRIKGKIGEVMALEDGYVGVKFKQHMEGHTLNDRCPDGYGWWVSPKNLEKIDKKTSRKAKESLKIIEKDRKLEGSINSTMWFTLGDRIAVSGATVKCHPDDEFNYETALSLLGKRLEESRASLDSLLEKTIDKDIVIFIDSEEALQDVTCKLIKKGCMFSTDYCDIGVSRTAYIQGAAKRIEEKGNIGIYVKNKIACYLTCGTLDYVDRGVVDYKSLKDFRGEI